MKIDSLQELRNWIIRTWFSSWDVIETKLWKSMSPTEKLEAYLKDLQYAQNSMRLSMANIGDYEIDKDIYPIYWILFWSEIHDNPVFSRLVIEIALWEKEIVGSMKASWVFWPRLKNINSTDRKKISDCATEIRKSFWIKSNTKLKYHEETILWLLCKYNEHYSYVNHRKSWIELINFLGDRISRDLIKSLNDLSKTEKWELILVCEIWWEEIYIWSKLNFEHWTTVSEAYLKLISWVEKVENWKEEKLKVLSVSYRTEKEIEQINNLKIEIVKIASRVVRSSKVVKRNAEKIWAALILNKVSSLSEFAVNAKAQCFTNSKDANDLLTILSEKEAKITEFQTLISLMEKQLKKVDNTKDKLNTIKDNDLLFPDLNNRFSIALANHGTGLSYQYYVDQIQIVRDYCSDLLLLKDLDLKTDILKATSKWDLDTSEQLIKEIEIAFNLSAKILDGLLLNIDDVEYIFKKASIASLLAEQSIELAREIKDFTSFLWEWELFEGLPDALSNANIIVHRLASVLDRKWLDEVYDAAVSSNDKIKEIVKIAKNVFLEENLKLIQEKEKALSLLEEERANRLQWAVVLLLSNFEYTANELVVVIDYIYNKEGVVDVDFIDNDDIFKFIFIQLMDMVNEFRKSWVCLDWIKEVISNIKLDVICHSSDA